MKFKQNIWLSKEDIEHLNRDGTLRIYDKNNDISIIINKVNEK